MLGLISLGAAMRACSTGVRRHPSTVRERSFVRFVCFVQKFQRSEIFSTLIAKDGSHWIADACQPPKSHADRAGLASSPGDQIRWPNALIPSVELGRSVEI